MTYCVVESFKQKRFKKPKFGKTRFVDFPAFLMDELKGYVIDLKKQNLKKGRGQLSTVCLSIQKNEAIGPIASGKFRAL